MFAMIRGGLPLGLALVVGACGESTDPRASTPATLSVFSGQDQVAPAGTLLPDPIVVRVTNAFNEPLANVDIAWEVDFGGGTLSAAAAQTDADGRAQVQFTLGPAAGAHAVVASVVGTTLSRVITALGT